MLVSCENLHEWYAHVNAFRLDNKFHDIVIKVENTAFLCHRIILASTLEYFRGVFSENPADAEKKEIEIKGVRAEDFELLLAYVYGSSINIKEENVCRLLQMSHYLGVRNLKKVCMNYIIEKSHLIPLNDVVSIFTLMCKLKKTLLLDKLTGLMAQNFVKIAKNEDFFRVSKELLLILAHPKLDRNSTAILDFLVQWLKFQNDEGKQCLPELLAAVNLQQMPTDYILETIASNAGSPNPSEIGSNVREWCQMSDVEDNKLVVEMMQLNTTTDLDENDEMVYAMSGKMKEIRFVLFTHDKALVNHSLHFINEYELITTGTEHFYKTQFINTHADFRNQKDLILYCKSVFINKICFTITITFEDLENHDTSYEFKLQPRCEDLGSRHISSNRDRYMSLEVMEGITNTRIPTEKGIAVTAHNTNIYVYNNFDFFLYNTQRDEWETLKMDNVSLTCFPNFLSHNDSLYFIGGKRCLTEHCLNRVYSSTLFQHYDTRIGKWFQMPEMNYPRFQSASCIYNDVLYVTGGEDLVYNKSYMEYFDFKAGKWGTFEKPMLKPKVNHILVADEDKLWFFGGQEPDKPASGVMEENLPWFTYNLKENAWSDMFSMTIPSHSNGNLYKTDTLLDIIVLEEA